MKTALRLAMRGLGTTFPNPSVGSVIVKGGHVIGRGWTQPGGRPHAETEALNSCVESPQGATAYVTLEPCSHHGKTPPCAQALVDAGISRVVFAIEDPDPKVNGDGMDILSNAGLVVESGVMAAQSEFVNAGFLKSRIKNQPMVTLKIAASMDAKTATASGQSKWITGPEARRAGHMLRANHDAVMVGIGTALADDPELTCRIAGLTDRSPLRIVADSRLRLPLTSQLVKSASDVPLLIVTAVGNDKARIQALKDLGVELIEAGVGIAGLPDMSEALTRLCERGITRLLVEGGAHLAASLIREKMVDRLEWFSANRIIGGDGLSALQSIGLEELDAAPLLDLIDEQKLGDDVRRTYGFRN